VAQILLWLPVTQTGRGQAVAGEQAEKEKLYATHKYVSAHAIAPPDVNFDRLHVGVIDTFRKGYWRTSPLNDDLPPSDHFSAFAFLTLLPTVWGDKPFFPANGVSFREGMKIVTAMQWLLYIGISISNEETSIDITGLCDNVPLVAVIRGFIHNLHHREGDPFLFATLWDSNPIHSQ
jgi:hypothetical protein